MERAGGVRAVDLQPPLYLVRDEGQFHKTGVAFIIYISWSCFHRIELTNGRGRGST